MHFQQWMERRGEYVDGLPTYQYHKYRAAREWVTRFGVAIDVGAHVGLWTRVMAKDFDHVLAFEPIPEHIECFRLNVTSPNVTLYDVAIGDRNQRVRFTRERENSGHTRVAGAGDIPMSRLDDLDVPNVDFMKIDTEGYEIFVLRGAIETIRRCRPTIIVEQKADMAEDYGETRRAAVQLLVNEGYHLRKEISGDYILSC
jgi:FkbM family methyltransferase